jgi:hypothetical protein
MQVYILFVEGDSKIIYNQIVLLSGWKRINVDRFCNYW